MSRSRCPEREVDGSPPPAAAFTLLELLVVVAIIAVLAGMLLPALARAQGTARKAACVGQLHQLGLGWQVYLDDHADRFPDRRDLKSALPGGYRPWSTWPKSDPRAGWAAVVLRDVVPSAATWACPSVGNGPLAKVEQASQWAGPTNAGTPRVTYWMWRFDRPDDPVPDDNFWGRSVTESVDRLRAANNPTAGIPEGPVDVECVVDPYFPDTIGSLPEAVRGWAAHRGGRNRLMLDGHVENLRDARLR